MPIGIMREEDDDYVKGDGIDEDEIGMERESLS